MRRPSPKAFAAALLAALLAGGASAAPDILDRGANHFLTGRLDSAIAFFTGVLKDNPRNSRAKEILANCLVIRGKEALRDGQYAQAWAALDKAKAYFPDNRELVTLSLLAQLETRAPTPGLLISTSAVSLDASAETAAVLDCLFGEGACAKGGRYAIHIVKEGETMAEIAIRYYNDLNQWEKIWAANPHINNPHRLEKGMRLMIPLD